MRHQRFHLFLIDSANGRLVGNQLFYAIQSISYGFLGLIFFLWVGLSVDLEGLFQAPALAIMLYLASGAGKLLGVYAMVPMKKLSIQEASIIGIGLGAQLNTEIIVAKMPISPRLASSFKTPPVRLAPDPRSNIGGRNNPNAVLLCL